MIDPESGAFLIKTAKNMTFLLALKPALRYISATKMLE